MYVLMYRFFFKSGSRDSIEILEISQSGNAVVDKCVITFASLALEVEILADIARNKHFNALIAYGEDGKSFVIAFFSSHLRKVGLFGFTRSHDSKTFYEGNIAFALTFLFSFNNVECRRVYSKVYLE